MADNSYLAMFRQVGSARKYNLITNILNLGQLVVLLVQSGFLEVEYEIRTLR